MELLYLVFGIGIGYLLFRPKKEEKAPLPFEKQIIHEFSIFLRWYEKEIFVYEGGFFG